MVGKCVLVGGTIGVADDEPVADVLTLIDKLSVRVELRDAVNDAERVSEVDSEAVPELVAEPEPLHVLDVLRLRDRVADSDAPRDGVCRLTLSDSDSDMLCDDDTVGVVDADVVCEAEPERDGLRVCDIETDSLSDGVRDGV